jgi:hypothetical protein
MRKPDGRRPLTLSKPEARSRITNGVELLPGVDEPSLWVRRFRDVLALHLSDLGGPDNTSEAEQAIARRAACLVVELEQLEQKFATQGASECGQLDQYQRTSNTLRRLLESLGLERRQRDVTPTPTVDRYVASLVGEGKAGNPLNAVTDADRAQVILAVLAENPKLLDQILKQLT